jgi:aryl-phospho-beta-D-glucosidase BglC (GH1 family)
MERLEIKSGKIVGQSGKGLMLRGSCVGGWMNMENFINGYPGSESTLRAVLAEALGAPKAEFFLDRMLDYALGEDDIRFMKACGATVVRLPLNYRHFEDDAKPFAYKESGFKRLDAMLGLCERYGLYAILDLHSVQGCQNSDWHCDNDSRHALLWVHSHFQDRYIALWEEFARRYAGRIVIAGYDVMNEPLCNASSGRFPFKYTRNWERINGLFRRVVESIRKIDRDHIIFLEGDYFASFFEGFEPPFAENLAYSSHNYTEAGFGPGAYPGIIKGAKWDSEKQREVFENHEGTRFARKHNAPLWVGEFGSVYNGPESEKKDRLRAMDDQLKVLNEGGAHWTTWTYKDVGVMGWVTLDPKSDYMQLVGKSLEAKRLLDTDQWMGWLPDTPAKAKVRELEAIVRETIGDNEIDQSADYAFLKQATLSGYVGSLMQPSYAKLFKGMSETRLDELASSFAFKNCVVNEEYVELLKKRMKA